MSAHRTIIRETPACPAGVVECAVCGRYVATHNGQLVPHAIELGGTTLCTGQAPKGQSS